MKKANGFKEMVRALELARTPFYTLENVYKEAMMKYLESA